MSPWGYRGRIISLLAGVAASLLVVNSSDAESRVQFHTVNAYFVVVPIYVDGHGPFEFVVDTGTNTTLISVELATELNLKPIGDGLLATVTGPQTVRRYFLDSVSLGTQSVPHLAVLAQRMKELQALNPGIRGVLGLDFLLEFAFLLDYGHQQIELYDASETSHISLPGTRQPIQLVQARILISAATEASVGGSWNLALDSGISRVAVFENAIRSSQDPQQEARGTVRVTTNLSSVSTSIAKVRDLAIGDIHIRDLAVVILPKSPTLQRDVEDGLLPTMLFRYIFVNPKRSYVIFELNDAFASQHRSWNMFCGNQKPVDAALQGFGLAWRVSGVLQCLAPSDSFVVSVLLSKLDDRTVRPRLLASCSSVLTRKPAVGTSRPGPRAEPTPSEANQGEAYEIPSAAVCCCIGGAPVGRNYETEGIGNFYRHFEIEEGGGHEIQDIRKLHRAGLARGAGADRSRSRARTPQRTLEPPPSLQAHRSWYVRRS